MSNISKLKADKREVLGRKTKSLRSEGFIPANIFGSGVKSLAITVSVEDFKTVEKQAGETGIVELNLGNDTRPALIDNIQVHPVSGEIIHIDFRQVDLKTKIETAVPVEVVGVSPAEKDGLGIMVQQIDEVEVEALPLDLPEKFVLDASVLVTLEDSIKVSDIKVSGDVKILTDPEIIIANIAEIKEEVVEAPQETEVAADAAEVKTEENKEEEN